MSSELPFYLCVKLDQFLEDVSAGARRKGLETALAYELFALESQIAEAKAQGNEKLAKAILDKPQLRQRIAVAPPKKSRPLRRARS